MALGCKPILANKKTIEKFCGHTFSFTDEYKASERGSRYFKLGYNKSMYLI